VTRLPPLWIQAGDYAASVDRRLMGALWPRGAVEGMNVGSDGAGLYVLVTEGSAAVPVARYGSDDVQVALCALTGAWEQVALQPAPPPGTDRIDAINIWVRSDDATGGAENDWTCEAWPGAPAPSPVPPDIAGIRGLGRLPIALVYVAGGAAVITNAAISRISNPPLAPLTSHMVPRGVLFNGSGPPGQVQVTNGLVWQTGNFGAGPNLPRHPRKFVRVTVAAHFTTPANSRTVNNRLTVTVLDGAGGGIIARDFWHLLPTLESQASEFPMVGHGSYTFATSAEVLQVRVDQAGGQTNPALGFIYPALSVDVAVDDVGSPDWLDPTFAQLPAPPDAELEPNEEREP
jgi:hypothetical protein